MCGIVGFASTRSDTQSEWISLGSESIKHRGPDDFGEWRSNDNRVGLAHRRLSIIDISSAGHQPMKDYSGRLRIIFNGEIYNYNDLRNELAKSGITFRSKSDTEVVLAAYLHWGKNCVKYLKGMFSFAIYDIKLRTILLARDRAGEKPLFYSMKNKTLYFASELKALLSNPVFEKKVDLDALDCYLTMGYVPADRCILNEFNKVKPGHLITFNLSDGSFHEEQYWSLPELSQDSKSVKNTEELVNELEVLLENSVKRQMVSDVPIGLLLSGGVDSSLITAMAARDRTKLKTFTIVFEGHKNYNELEHANLISEYFETDHNELNANPSSVEMLSSLAHQYDEPIIDSSIIPTFLLTQQVSNFCKVALGGDGGDELFGGYEHYSRLLKMLKYFNIIPLSLRKIISNVSLKILPVGFKGRNWLDGVGTNFDTELPLIAKYFDKNYRNKIISNNSALNNNAEKIYLEQISKSKDFLEKATRQDFKNYLPEDILVKVDRASMLNSLEMRSPFLDCDLIEFAFGKVPSSLKSTTSQKKILLKSLAKKVLPPNFDFERKQGFCIPINEWLRKGDFREFFMDVLFDTNCSINREISQMLFKGQDNGRNNGERLFGLVFFELWRKHYNVSI